MSRNPRIVFVGQGPNRACWMESLEKGMQLRPTSPESFAVERCNRLALTGSVGVKLACLLGQDRLEFLANYERRNLNGRWNGKIGKGDRFDDAVGRQKAEAMIAERVYSKYVLLGASVWECFGHPKAEPLSKMFFEPSGPSFFLVPHPSGINQWWNDPKNRALAKARLLAFLAQ